MKRSEAAVPAGIFLLDQSHLKSRGFFYVGGQYTDDGTDLMDGQMYVEVYVPETVAHPLYP